MKRSTLPSLISLAGATVLICGGSALAATNSFIVDLNKSFGDSYTGVTGTMNFLFGDGGDSNPSTYTLDLTIANTSSSPISASSLTGFAFDTPTSVTSLVYNRNGTAFYQATDGNTISPAPAFTFCASTDNNINNGTKCGAGSVPQGLSNGSSATVKYTFNYAGSTQTVDGVTTAFLNLFNGLQISPPPNSDKAVNSTVVLAARFQGINTNSGSTGGSDKVTGKPRVKPPPGPPDAVPGPLPLLGTAVAFAQSRRLRRRLATVRTGDSNQV